MKILVLNYEYPPLGGGAGVVTQNLSQKLAEFGHRVTVVCTWFPGELVREETGNLTIIRLRAKREYKHRSSVFEMLSWMRVSRVFLRDFARGGVFDVCLTNFSVPGGVVADYLNKKFGLKYVLISHGHDIPWIFPRQMFFYHLLLYFKIRKICFRSQMNIVFTEEMKVNIDRLVGSKRANWNKIIPNGVNFERFAPEYSRRNDVFKILFVGRLVSQKDPVTFLMAIKLYLVKNPNILVNVIGDGVLRPSLERFILDNGLRGIVNISGWLAPDKVIEEYQSAHVHVISSAYEAMSVSILESVASGCYLITTPVGGIKELRSQNVNITEVSFRSPEQIAVALDRYWADKSKSDNRLSSDRMAAFKQKYSWDVIARKYEKCLSESLAK